MATEERPSEISDAQLEEWWRAHNGKAADGGPAGIGIQARDRLIRKLVDEVRRLRATVERSSSGTSAV